MVVALFYYLTVARSMFIAADDAPRIEVSRPLLCWILAFAIVAGAGGLAPQVFVNPAVKAAESMTIPLSR
jgi:NADH:ubiquinone oxidoreductase subunit 2 (subunit N)